MAKTLIDATEVRHKALASNIANIETPGYKRVDLSKDFAVQLRKAAENGRVSEMQQLHASVEIDESARTSRKDGNNVSLDEELLKMNQNSLQYEFLAQYVGNSLKSIRTAITGTV